MRNWMVKVPDAKDNLGTFAKVGSERSALSHLLQSAVAPLVGA